MSPLEEITSVIRQRRSIKPVDMAPDKAVPRELLETLLTNATWAPTHGLTEPWCFTVFQEEARSALASSLQAIYKLVTPASEFRDDKFQKMGDNPRLAPVVVAVSMIRKGAPKIPAVEEIEAVACAVQNLMLSATAAGLASFWSSPPLLGSGDFKQWLKLGKEDECVGLIYLGWPKENAAGARSIRQPLENFVDWRY